MTTQELWRQIEASANKYSSLPVVQDESGVSETYAQVQAASITLAQKLDVGPGHAVGVLSSSASHTMRSLWGTWAAGACFVPLSPADPPERNARKMRQAAVTHLVADAKNADRAAAAMDVVGSSKRLESDGSALFIHSGQPRTLPTECAAIYFTSGTTGTPKAVAIKAEALLRVGRWSADLQGIAPGASVALCYPSYFDAFLQVALQSSLRGARLVDCSYRTLGRRDGLRCALLRHEVSHLDATPTLLTQLLRDMRGRPGVEGLLPRLRFVVSGGETLRWDIAQRLKDAMPHVRLFNMYGPTEATITALAYEYDGKRTALGSSVPLGDAVPGIGIRLRPYRDDLLELVLHGDNLALGYFDASDSDANANLARTVESYATGDLVRRVADSLHFVGRLDRQLSLRGMRVEAGEIEEVAMRLPFVSSAFAWVGIDRGHPRILLACAVDASSAANCTALEAAFARELPSSLTPSRIFQLSAFPTTANGKMDMGAIQRLCPP